MKTVSTLKPSKTDSPKTPGGISRSLLTPCRRVGLSRNFRKSGTSPFQSPLSSNTEVNQEKIETRKRKEPLQETQQKHENNDCNTYSDVQTPTRNVELPRRKKSKTLLACINKTTEESAPETHTELKISTTFEDKSVPEIVQKDVSVENEVSTEVVSTPVRLKSKSRSKKKIAPSITISTDIPAVDLEANVTINPASIETKDNVHNNQKETTEKSPNNLTKECIVVIQKKIFMKELKVKQETPTEKPINMINQKDTVSQALFDSDSDDVPLICLNNKEITNKPARLKITDGDDDFTSKTRKSKPENSKSSIAKTNTKSLTCTKNKKSLQVVNVEVHQPSTQSSVDDDDDFFEKKRTILVKKSYDKLKPQKAKSTGSITQKDIDDLKAKIEMKKKMLLVKGMTEDTKELRDLIKKWQKGCQDALMELMDLMKSKFPEKQNMDYSEMLQTLKIPSSLVGYDSDNDCFTTPEDSSIILANVKV